RRQHECWCWRRQGEARHSIVAPAWQRPRTSWRRPPWIWPASSSQRSKTAASRLLARHRSQRSSPILGPGLDSIVVPIPSRDWALSAIEDLRREGMSAELVGQNAARRWLVWIEGPAASIAEIRFSLQ